MVVAFDEAAQRHEDARDLQRRYRLITNYADRIKKAADSTPCCSIEYGSSTVAIGVCRDDALHHVDECGLLPLT